MPLPAWCLTLSYGMPPPHRAIRILFLCTNLPFFGCGVALAARAITSPDAGCLGSSFNTTRAKQAWQ